ncbi:MAG: hypothetical protein LBB12_03090 [Holosporaceae bacterium]|jgi:hypothetical protein|nr:hypothetical protein [Holosporaceae bacterium]
MKLQSIILVGAALGILDANALEPDFQKAERAKVYEATSVAYEKLRTFDEKLSNEEVTSSITPYSIVKNFIINMDNASTFMLGMITAAESLHIGSASALDARDIFIQKLRILNPEQLAEKGRNGIEILEEAFQLSQQERPELLSNFQSIRDELEKAGIRISSNNQVMEVEIEEIIPNCCGFLWGLIGSKK